MIWEHDLKKMEPQYVAATLLGMWDDAAHDMASDTLWMQGRKPGAQEVPTTLAIPSRHDDSPMRNASYFAELDAQAETTHSDPDAFSDWLGDRLYEVCEDDDKRRKAIVTALMEMINMPDSIWGRWVGRDDE